MAVWDFDSWVVLSTRHVELARASGALAPLSIALNGRGQVATHCGDFKTATSLAAEKDVLNGVTGIRLASTCDLLLAGYGGRPAEATPLFSATTEDSIARGEGGAVQLASWAAAVLHNGLGHYAEALAAAEPATEETYQPLCTQLVLPELIEAAVRTGRAELAREALERLSAMTAIEGSDWAKGLEARSQALLSEGQDAEHRYAEAVEQLGRTQLRPELARAHLLYREWLRRVEPAARRPPPASRRLPSARRDRRRSLCRARAPGTARHRRKVRNCESTPTASSPRRRSTSSGWPEMAAPTPRLPRSYSSAPVPSNGTCAPGFRRIKGVQGHHDRRTAGQRPEDSAKT